MLDAILTTAAGDFGHLGVVHSTQMVVRLIVAGVLGGIIGWERQNTGHAAGFRTHILVSLGAAAFVMVPLHAGFATADVSRIIQGLVTGIGFLGAGCIVRDESEGRVKGLTTAAGIWLTSSIGLAAGLGLAGAAIVLGIAGWVTLDVLYYFEKQAKKNKPVKPKQPT